MDLGIAGKTALVTGGSRGIGLGIARALAAAGCRVGIVARCDVAIEAALDQIRSDGGEAQGLSLDLSLVENFDRAVEAVTRLLGSPDIAIFNPPTPGPGSFLSLSETDFEAGYRQLVSCFARMVRCVVPAMRERRWGRIVTVGSASVRQPIRGQANFSYAAANTNRLAAVSISKTISAELAPMGITVNTIATGTIATDTAHAFYTAQAAEAGMTFNAFMQFLMAQVPMGREGRVEEIASLAAYLCSAQAGYTTGETILCDGGFANSPL